MRAARERPDLLLPRARGPPDRGVHCSRKGLTQATAYIRDGSRGESRVEIAPYRVPSVNKSGPVGH